MQLTVAFNLLNRDMKEIVALFFRPILYRSDNSIFHRNIIWKIDIHVHVLWKETKALPSLCQTRIEKRWLNFLSGAKWFCLLAPWNQCGMMRDISEWPVDGDAQTRRQELVEIDSGSAARPTSTIIDGREFSELWINTREIR